MFMTKVWAIDKDVISEKVQIYSGDPCKMNSQKTWNS